jgi:uncharacterized protein DUF4242
MPKYLVVRNFDRVTDDELGQLALSSKRIAIAQFPDIVWHHSHVVVDGKGVVRTFCVYSAPTEDMVREHAAAFGGHKIDDISEIAGDVDPEELVV